jgi:hypothetical protein
VSGPDVPGLLLCGDMRGTPHDLLAGLLGVRPDRMTAALPTMIDDREHQ